MNVRKMSATTFSLIALIVGLIYLAPLIPRNQFEWQHTIVARYNSFNYIGEFHIFILTIAVWFIVIVGIVDAILRNRVGMSLFHSLNIPLVLGVVILFLAFVPFELHLFWAIFYVVVTYGVYWSFRKFISNNQSGGQELIPFIKGLKSGVMGGNGDISDRYMVYWVSVTIVALLALIIISFIAYAITNWNMFF